MKIDGALVCRAEGDDTAVAVARCLSAQPTAVPPEATGVSSFTPNHAVQTD